MVDNNHFNWKNKSCLYSLAFSENEVSFVWILGIFKNKMNTRGMSAKEWQREKRTACFGLPVAFNKPQGAQKARGYCWIDEEFDFPKVRCDIDTFILGDQEALQHPVVRLLVKKKWTEYAHMWFW
jgi:hypothetical protein